MWDLPRTGTELSLPYIKADLQPPGLGKSHLDLLSIFSKYPLTPEMTCRLLGCVSTFWEAKEYSAPRATADAQQPSGFSNLTQQDTHYLKSGAALASEASYKWSLCRGNAEMTETSSN